MLPASSNHPRSLAFFAVAASFSLAVPGGIGNPDATLPLPSWGEGEGPDNTLVSLSLFPDPLPSDGDFGSGLASLPVPPLPPRDPNAPFQPLLEPLELQPLVVLDGGIEPELESIPSGPGETEILLEDFQIYRSLPDKFLVNPQHLLSEPQEFDLSEFLEYHASESGIPIYILLADGGQRMPDRFDLADTVDSWFPDSPACVVLYYFGFPTRSEIALSPPLRRSANTTSGVELVEHASEDALVASDPVDQLSRFSVRTSIRMFWLEKLFRDSASATAAAEPAPSSFSAATAALASLFKSPGFYAAIFALAALAAALHLARAWRVSRTGGQVYIFPDFEFAPRLGAPHRGGTNIVVDFERHP